MNNNTEIKTHIMPFVDVRGSDTTEKLREKFASLKARGIYSAVLQYAGSGETGSELTEDTAIFNRVIPFDAVYFSMLDRLSDVCEELGMTFWVQDAAPFPTGNANGLFADKYPDMTKKCIIEHHIDFKGPRSEAVVLSGNFNYLCNGDVERKLKNVFDIVMRKKTANKLIGASLVPRKRSGSEVIFDIDNAIDLADGISQGLINFNASEGEWRLFLFFETRACGRENYMNIIDRGSVSVQIEGVHEPHYEKLKQKLGRTWAGFFYDEPEFGNTPGYIFDCLPGYRFNGDSIPLPWSDELYEKLVLLGKGNVINMLPALWYPCGENTRILRYLYMDSVTKLAEENYNGQVHEWCRQRGIPYIGHALEDENSHSRLGCGPGHFFRFQKYQDMAGIDIVGGQIMPGCDFKGYSWYGCSNGDGEFYHYGLAKLASSEAHISPLKDGRSVCEFNAVYSGISDARLQKFLADHLFVRGVNNLIPVASDELPEKHGKLLFDYCSRMCRLLNRSRTVIPVALLYHAESEWAGDFQFFHIPGTKLLTSQIDFDVVPCDALTEDPFYWTELNGSELVINSNTYKALVIPYCRYIRKDTAEFIRKAAIKGIKVFFTDKLPEGYCETTQKAVWDDVPVNVVSLDWLPEVMFEEGISDIRTSSEQKYLRYSHFVKDGQHHYMFMNEDPGKEIHTDIVIPFSCSIRKYDVMNDITEDMDFLRESSTTKFSLSLKQLESIVIICDDTGDPVIFDEDILLEIKDFTVSDEDGNLRYSAGFDLSDTDRKGIYLDLGNVYSSAEVIINGRDAGLRIATPYVYDISEMIIPGRNELIIKTTCNNQDKEDPARYYKLFGILSAATYTVHTTKCSLGTITLYIKQRKNQDEKHW